MLYVWQAAWLQIMAIRYNIFTAAPRLISEGLQDIVLGIDYSPTESMGKVEYAYKHRLTVMSAKCQETRDGTRL